MGRAAYECAARPRWLARGRCSSVLPELRHAEPGYGADVLQVQLQRQRSGAAQVQGHDAHDESAADSGPGRPPGSFGGTAGCASRGGRASAGKPCVRSPSTQRDGRGAARRRQQIEGYDGRGRTDGRRFRCACRPVPTASRGSSGAFSISPATGRCPAYPAASGPGSTRGIRLFAARAPGRRQPARRDDGGRREPVPVWSAGWAGAVRRSAGRSPAAAGDAGHGQSAIPVRRSARWSAAAAWIRPAPWRLRCSASGPRRLRCSASRTGCLRRSAGAARIRARASGGV